LRTSSIEDRLVVVVVVLMAIGFIQVDLLIALFQRFLAIADELEQVLLALDGNVFLQTDVVRSLASTVAVLLEPTVPRPLDSHKVFLIKESTIILGDFDDLLLNQEVEDLPASYVLSSASLVSNKFSYGRHNLQGLRNSSCPLAASPSSYTLVSVASLIEVIKDLLEGAGGEREGLFNLAPNVSSVDRQLLAVFQATLEMLLLELQEVQQSLQRQIFGDCGSVLLCLELLPVCPYALKIVVLNRWLLSEVQLSTRLFRRIRAWERLFRPCRGSSDRPDSWGGSWRQKRANQPQTQEKRAIRPW
jgi:hypothetical protein